MTVHWIFTIKDLLLTNINSGRRNDRCRVRMVWTGQWLAMCKCNECVICMFGLLCINYLLSVCLLFILFLPQILFVMLRLEISMQSFYISECICTNHCTFIRSLVHLFDRAQDSMWLFVCLPCASRQSNYNLSPWQHKCDRSSSNEQLKWRCHSCNDHVTTRCHASKGVFTGVIFPSSLRTTPHFRWVFCTILKNQIKDSYDDVWKAVNE